MNNINSMDDGYESQSNGRRASAEDEEDDELKSGKTKPSSKNDTNIDFYKKYEAESDASIGKGNTMHVAT